jgi:hypothetical protein
MEKLHSENSKELLLLVCGENLTSYDACEIPCADLYVYRFMCCLKTRVLTVFLPWNPLEGLVKPMDPHHKNIFKSKNKIHGYRLCNEGKKLRSNTFFKMLKNNKYIYDNIRVIQRI